MGTVYRRQVRVCTRCAKRLDTTRAQRACLAARHRIATRAQAVWWITYTRKGRVYRVSSGSRDRDVALALLRTRERGTDDPVVPEAVAPTAPAPTSDPPVPPVTFEEAAADVVQDYTLNGRRSLRVVLLRLRKHLTPFFGGRALASIRTADVRAFTGRRHAAGASNASINRDLILLKRMYTLSVQAGTVVGRPYIPLLREANVRTGFFEREQFERIHRALPRHMRGIAAFAFVTGWRTPSEILPLEWRHIDRTAGEVRLDAGTTKNGEARTFPVTRALRRVLDAQQIIAEDLTAAGLVPRYVFCYPVGPKAAQPITESGFNFHWKRARIAAECPGRIPHDFRRTAVRNLVRAGVPERVAMQLSGHKTRAIFERYNITSPNDLRDAARRLDAFAEASAPEPR